jgi:hypothetical protein
LGGVARADLVGQWKSDTYTGGASWTDSSGKGNTATAVGTIATAPNTFNGHPAVLFTGGDGAAATGFFKVTNSATVAVGATGLTMVAVFKPTAANTSTGGQFWQKSGLIGNENPGAVNDWGLGYGASQADVGIGNPDTTIVSGTVPLNQGLVEIGTWDTSGKLTLYVNGVQVAQNTAAPTAARDANALGAFALGASLGTQNGDTHVLTGQVAELRLYNDNTESIAALTSSLSQTYAVPEPSALGLLGLAGFTTMLRRKRASL